MTTQHIGIIGAGQMGQGIAEVFWRAGHKIYLFDADPIRLDQAYQNLIEHLERAIDKGTESADEWEHFLDRLVVCIRLTGMASCAFVIEAIVEDVTVKAKLFTDLGDVVAASCIIATNTSSLSVTELSAYVKNPERFLGVHFFNPAYRLPLVEVIPQAQTSSAVFDDTHALLTEVGKTPIVCADSPGFIVNRLLLPMINQAALLCQNDVASAIDIDASMKLGANFPMGPLALADLIGLDTCVLILDSLAKACDDASYKPADILLNYVKAGKLGVKSKEGFFNYQ
ncbi:MAG: 3-hydroxyacyl-CoA dehydrogenase family protein [Pseudomonadota bacterium]